MADTVAPGDLLPTVPVATKGSSTPTPKVGDVLPTVEPGNQKLLENAPNETETSGTLKNIGTSIIKGLPHFPSPANPVFANDLGDMVNYIMARGKSALTGVPVEQVLARHAQMVKRREEAGPSWIPNLSLPSGEDVTKPILEKTGEYTPTTTAGRIGSAGVQAATAMGPGGLRGLVQRVLTGGTMGAAGQAATEYTGDPLAGIAAASVVPSALARTAKIIQPTLDQYRPSRFQSAADERFLGQTQDPEQALRRLTHPEQTIVPGSDPSTAEATLDPGLITADKMAKAKTAQYQMAQKAREARQNAARGNLIEQNADVGADPVAVADQFRKYVADIETTHQQNVNAAESRAKQQASGIAKTDLDERGESLRTGLNEAKGTEQSRLGELYNSIDPEGKLNVLATPVTGKVQEILQQPNRDLATHSALAEEALNKAASLKNVVPFARLRALDQTLTLLMKQAGRTGDTGYGDIVALKGAVKDAIANAAENQVKYENDLVARGEMSPEDTFASKLAQQRDAFYAGKESTATDGGIGQNAPRRPGGIPPNAGAPGGPGTEGSGEGLLHPNLEPDTSQRLADVNRQYGEFKSLYGSEPLAGALKIRPGGMKGDYQTPDAQVAAKAFPAGDNGYNATSLWLKGNTSPDAMPDIKSIAVSRLRDMMKDETLAPETLNAWRAKYGPALKAIDEVSPGFSDNFNTAASAGRALNRAIADQKLAVKEAQQGEAARFLNLKDADDVRAMVGTAMSAKNSGQRISEIIDRMQGNDTALAGLRKAAVDWLLGRTGAAKMGVDLQGENLLSADKITKFVDANPSAIQKLFGDDGLTYLRAVAKDLNRTQQVLTAQSTPGSDTASKLFGNMLDRFQKHQEGGTVSDALNLASAAELFHGEPVTAIKIKLGQKVWEKIQGMLDARANEGNQKITSLMLEGLDKPEVAKLMLKRALDAKGKPNTAAFTRLYQLLGMTQQAEEGERRARASSGSVSRIDYAAKAAQLLRMAEKAKKAHGKMTAGLLRYPDEIISGALRLANQDR